MNMHQDKDVTVCKTESSTCTLDDFVFVGSRKSQCNGTRQAPNQQHEMPKDKFEKVEGRNSESFSKKTSECRRKTAKTRMQKSESQKSESKNSHFEKSESVRPKEEPEELMRLYPKKVEKLKKKASKQKGLQSISNTTNSSQEERACSQIFGGKGLFADISEFFGFLEPAGRDKHPSTSAAPEDELLVAPGQPLGSTPPFSTLFSEKTPPETPPRSPACDPYQQQGPSLHEIVGKNAKSMFDAESKETPDTACSTQTPDMNENMKNFGPKDSEQESEAGPFHDFIGPVQGKALHTQDDLPALPKQEKQGEPHDIPNQDEPHHLQQLDSPVRIALSDDDTAQAQPDKTASPVSLMPVDCEVIIPSDLFKRLTDMGKAIRCRNAHVQLRKGSGQRVLVLPDSQSYGF